MGLFVRVVFRVNIPGRFVGDRTSAESARLELSFEASTADAGGGGEARVRLSCELPTLLEAPRERFYRTT
jgi:hypothetical protein